MSRDWEGEFEDLAQEFYPGSARPIIRHGNRPEAKTQGSSVGMIDGWDKKPRIYSVGGVEREFFTVGNLADALGREPVTIRKWEREGIIPKSTYTAPSPDPRGRRRLYTREQIEGMVKIAAEEGILISHQKPIKATAFTVRVVALFKRLLEDAA